jgi:drug/metabolite transporter (DMT)-like permease
VNPVVAGALGVAFLGERRDAPSARGAAIVMGAVVVVARARALGVRSANEVEPPAGGLRTLR